MLELGGAVLALIGIGLMIQRRQLCWVFNTASSAIYALLFYSKEYPAQSALQLLFIGLSAYGFFAWKEEKFIPIKLRTTVLLSMTILVGVGTFLFGFKFRREFLDMFLALMSVAATLIGIKKGIDSWALWIGIDIALTMTFLLDGLYPTALLYAVFTLLAVKGLREWENLAVGRQESRLSKMR